MTALWRIWTLLTKLLGVGAAGAAATIGMVAKQYTVRAAAVAALAIAFYAIYDTTHDLIKTALNSASASMISEGNTVFDSVLLFSCMLPASTASAFSTLFSITILAVTLKWARMLMFAKLA